MSISTELPEPDIAAWVRNSIGPGAQIAFEALAGATSSSVYAVAVDGVRRFVLRLFTDRDWLGREADLADHEAAALTHAERAGLPAPRLIGVATQYAVPALLMTFLPGTIELRPRRRKAWLKGLAETLAQIHAVDVGTFAWWYSSWNPHTHPAIPQWLEDDALWSSVLELAAGQPADHEQTFLHRDYHPANVLWQNASVSGVVDWVNACRGPAGVDVAHCRVNLALMRGVRDADDFLQAYAAAVGGYEHDPYWDIDAAMGWSIQDPTYYPPWSDFGLRPISRGELRDRTRAFLQSAVARGR